MVYAPQRRHAVASMSTTLQALALVQHFYAPNMLVLLCRVFSLIPAVFFHVIGDGEGGYDTKGLMLDFVGQGELLHHPHLTAANPGSLTRVLILDLVIFLLQLVTLIVCYIVNYSPTLPKSDVFPFDDLLLPPEASTGIRTEADLDVESGGQLRQRRHGKGPRYQNLATDESGSWPEGEEEELPAISSPSRSPSRASTPIRRGRSGVPLVFSIPLGHMLNLIVRLPGPSPMRVASGGTPLASPPASPRGTQDEMSLLTTAVAQASVQGGSQLPNAGMGGSGRPPLETAAGGSRDEGRRTESEEDDMGRIPGDYWTSGAR
ncbi:unnamed protein product [Cutaneotrichosporon oleaginosum]